MEPPLEERLDRVFGDVAAADEPLVSLKAASLSRRLSRNFAAVWVSLKAASLSRRLSRNFAAVWVESGGAIGHGDRRERRRRR
jgi:hypothetical protein